MIAISIVLILGICLLIYLWKKSYEPSLSDMNGLIYEIRLRDADAQSLVGGLIWLELPFEVYYNNEWVVIKSKSPKTSHKIFEWSKR